MLIEKIKCQLKSPQRGSFARPTAHLTGHIKIYDYIPMKEQEILRWPPIECST